MEKTSLCKYFAAGHCQTGSKCTYAHGKSDLKERQRTVPCHYFESGTCYKGYECRFLHVEKAPTQPKRSAEEPTLTAWEQKRSQFVRNDVICEFIKQNRHCAEGFRCHDLHHVAERRLLKLSSSDEA